MNVEKLKDLTTEQITELWKGNVEHLFSIISSAFYPKSSIQNFLIPKKHIKHQEIQFLLLLRVPSSPHFQSGFMVLIRNTTYNQMV